MFSRRIPSTIDLKLIPITNTERTPKAVNTTPESSGLFKVLKTK
jgi:hypothetical protein